MADVSAALNSWSATASSNNPNDNTTLGAGLADNLQAIQAVVRGDLASIGSAVASSAAPDVGAVTGLMHSVSGTATITGLGSSATAGLWKILQFESTPQLTHSTALQLLGGANITAAAGDVGIFVCQASNVWKNVSWFKNAISPFASASASAAGVVELATDAEVLTGTDTTRAVTPSALESILGLAKLASTTIGSATAVADITMTGYTGYAHKLLVLDLLPATDAVQLVMRVSTNGGTDFDSTANGYTDAATYTDDAGTHSAVANTVASGATGIALSLGGNVGNGATEGINARVFMTNTTSTAKWPRFSYDAEWISADATPRVVTWHGSGTRRSAQDTDAVRVFFNSGNIASGTWTLYGFN